MPHACPSTCLFTSPSTRHSSPCPPPPAARRPALRLATAALTTVALALPWLSAMPVEAGSRKAGQHVQAPPASKSAKSAKSGQRQRVRQAPSGSEETRAERERRLKRECKGRPNAGACLGFAS